MYTALQLLKDEITNARETFDGTMADVTVDMLHKDPGAKAFPLGATYAHLIFSEDAIVHGMLQGKAPLSETTFKDKTGASSPMPAMDENWAVENEKWSKSVKIDLEMMREYAKAVFAATDTYVETLKDEDLDKEVDLGSWGKKTIAYMLYAFVIGHTNSLAGELSVLKGIQGAKGYAF